MLWHSLALRRLAIPFALAVLAACSGEDERPPPLIVPVDGQGGELVFGDGDGDGDGDGPNDMRAPLYSLLDDDLPAPICNILQEQRLGVAEEITSIQPPQFHAFIHPETFEAYYHTNDHNSVMTLDGPVDMPPSCTDRVSAFTMRPETGELFFECDDSDLWYDEEGDLFAECPGLMYIGRDESLVCNVRRNTNRIWEYSFRADPSAPLEIFEFPMAVDTVFRPQARPDGGFWFLTYSARFDRYSTLEDGSSEYDFSFFGGSGGPGSLSAEGWAYIPSQETGFVDVIQMRTTDSTEKVFEENADCSIRGQVTYMFTIP